MLLFTTKKFSSVKFNTKSVNNLEILIMNYVWMILYVSQSADENATADQYK